jgi:hypothetical protein
MSQDNLPLASGMWSSDERLKIARLISGVEAFGQGQPDGLIARAALLRLIACLQQGILDSMLHEGEKGTKLDRDQANELTVLFADLKTLIVIAAGSEAVTP